MTNTTAAPKVQDPRMSGEASDEMSELLECALAAWQRFDASGDLQSFGAARMDTLEAASLFQAMSEAMQADAQALLVGGA